MKLSEIRSADTVGGDVLSLRYRLRAATEAEHSLLDRRMSRMLQEQSGGYEKFLALMATVILPMESALNEAQVWNILPDWPQRTRSEALLADLAELDISAPDGGRSCSHLPLSDEAYVHGVLYVLEGSRLGGRVILRGLEQAQRRRPTHYLSHGHGSTFWQTFLVQLEGSHAARDNPEAAITGAKTTFSLFLE